MHRTSGYAQQRYHEVKGRYLCPQYRAVSAPRYGEIPATGGVEVEIERQTIPTGPFPIFRKKKKKTT